MINSTTATRRSFVTALLAGPVTGSAVLAQETDQVSVDPSIIMEIHRSQLTSASELLGASLALSRAGLEESLLNIRDHISDVDLQIIQDFISIIFDSAGIEELLEKARAIFSEVTEALSNLGKTIVAIIVDSIEYAASEIPSVNYTLIAKVICHDVSGALYGAGGGAAIGSVFPGIGTAVGAIWGAVAGGGSASVIGFFDDTARSAT